MLHVEGRPTVAEVSLGALRENCRQARGLVGDKVGVLAVVKADGYGHGATASARAFLEAGAVGLGVSMVAEGIALRQAGITAPIVVLGGVFDGEEPIVVANDMAAAVWTVDRARALGAAAKAAGTVAALHVKVNTGMTRLGVDVDEVRRFGAALTELPDVRVAGIFSHFASADAVDTAQAHAQRDRFRTAVDELRAARVEPQYVHFANSAAVLCEPEAHFNLVRPGLMLYGYAPAPHLASVAALQPAMRLRTRLAQVRKIPPGTPVGYGGTWVSSRPSAIGTLPLGYADGLHRLASNRAQMLVGGRRVDIAGRVCMDHVMLDVTEVTSAAAGDPVVVFGAQGRETISANELAAWTDTITYEVLTSVGKRVPRVYVEEFDG
jgi:alanine racemase